MPWIYQQKTGFLFVNTIFVGTGYCGHGTGLDNPAAQDQSNVGPIPTGSYAIGPPHTPVDHMGPMALPLYPDQANQMFGRFGFFMHGDNQFGNRSASNGCVIMAPDIRSQVLHSGEKTLLVVSGDAPQQDDSVDRLLMAPFREAFARSIAPATAPQPTDFVDRLIRDRLSSMLAGSTIPEALFRTAAPINAYPELPVLPFLRTTVAMEDVIAAFNASDKLTDVKRASYVMFRIESGNGAHGINNNYCGAQADGGRWPDSLTSSFSGTVTHRENVTERLRIFLAFKTIAGNLDFIMDRVLSRGIYIGGRTHHVLTMSVDTEDDLARAYHKEWVTGSADSEPSTQDKADFLSMYRQAVERIT